MKNQRLIVLATVLCVAVFCVLIYLLQQDHQRNVEITQRTDVMKKNSVIALFLDTHPAAVFEVVPGGKTDVVYADNNRLFYIEYTQESGAMSLYCLDRSDESHIKTVFTEDGKEKIRERIIRNDCQ